MHVLNWFWQNLKSQHEGPDGSPLREIVCFLSVDLDWMRALAWPLLMLCIESSGLAPADAVLYILIQYLLQHSLFSRWLLLSLLVLDFFGWPFCVACWYEEYPWVTHLYQASWTQHWEPNSAVVLSPIQGLFGGKLLGFIFVHNMDSIKFRIKTLVLYSVNR